ncbi:YbgA family protein [Staphylococcus aureus]|uniref:YbgA family protein n=1 Tax=Staphylococcus aureus TaxID=1280 RepID=UPI0028F6D201|nr:YbgA family protein [Staphylococcus aureus]
MKERGYIEQLWREEKYHALLHSQQSYQMIRNALKTDLSLHQVQQMIDVALLIEPSIGSVCNAFDHMWGYLKKCANEEERQQSKLLKADFINGKIDTQTLLDFLAELANKYDVQYLLQSRVLNTKRKR